MKKALSKIYGENFLPSPWFRYWVDIGERSERESEITLSESKPNYCCPDGILFLDGKIILIEIKLSHCEDAYFQLRELYEPIAQFYFGMRFEYQILEICLWYDGTKKMPEKIELRPDEKKLTGGFNVKIWKPS